MLDKEKELAILETTLLLLDGTKESDILLKYNLAPYLKKAKEVVRLICN